MKFNLLQLIAWCNDNHGYVFINYQYHSVPTLKRLWESHGNLEYNWLMNSSLTTMHLFK